MLSYLCLMMELEVHRAGSQEEKMNVKWVEQEKSLTCKCKLCPRKWTET